MMLDGLDLRRMPWIDRRKRLKRLLGRRALGLTYNDHFIGDYAAVYRAACRMEQRHDPVERAKKHRSLEAAPPAAERRLEVPSEVTAATDAPNAARDAHRLEAFWVSHPVQPPSSGDRPEPTGAAMFTSGMK
jgi:hypothetical protein